MDIQVIKKDLYAM
jgi:hypothetical protein